MSCRICNEPSDKRTLPYCPDCFIDLAVVLLPHCRLCSAIDHDMEDCPDFACGVCGLPHFTYEHDCFVCLSKHPYASCPKKCQICIQKGNPFPEHRTTDHKCDICRKNHHTDDCIDCYFCCHYRRTNLIQHTAKDHICKRCQEKGHCSDVCPYRCNYCNEVHRTEDHKCSLCDGNHSITSCPHHCTICKNPYHKTEHHMCQGCKRYGHGYNECPHPPLLPNHTPGSVRCDRCGGVGHSIDFCMVVKDI